MIVREIMITRLITVTPDDTLSHAANLLRQHQFHHLPVVREVKAVEPEKAAYPPPDKSFLLPDGDEFGETIVGDAIKFAGRTCQGGDVGELERSGASNCERMLDFSFSPSANTYSPPLSP